MKLKLACTDFTFPLLPHDDALGLIAKLGFEGVDIGLFGGGTHLQPKAVTRNVVKAAHNLSTRVRDQGLEISDMFLIPDPDLNTLAVNHPQATVRRRSRDLFQRVLEFTLRCNAQHITVLPGMPWKEEPHEASLRRSADELAWRCERATQLNVVFSVEPHYDSLVPTPKLAQQLVGMTPGLTFTLDYTHFVFQGIPVRQVDSLLKHTSHFHARGGAKQRIQTPMKDNVIDYPRVLRAMKRTGYKGYLALEYEWSHSDEADTLSETILLRDVLKNAT